MAAGLGFKTFTTGEVLTAADTNGYLMQGINVFASSAARAAAITSPQEGQYSYLKDTNALEYYDGAAWVGAPVGDITAVTAGKGLTGGGSSGDVTVSLATTAKGDLVVGTGTTTAAALTVGNNGETLVADSSTSTGLRYQSAYNGNGIINGGMDIWQRGTSFALTSPGTAYTADRWLGRQLGTNVTYSQQTSGLTGIQYGLRVQRPAGTTGTNDQQIYYQFETADAYRFAGQTVTLSFYAKAGANFSGGSSLLGAGIYSGTGTNQNITSGAYTGQVTVANETKTLTTSYQRFSVTGTVGSTATQIAIIFGETPTGTAGANDWYEITGVQLELGSVATSFKRSAGGSIQGELAACQRYYNTNVFAFRNITQANAGASFAITTYLPQMRTGPTLAFTAAASASANISGTPTLDYLTSDGSTYISRMSYTATSANTDTYYVRSFSASSEL